MRDLKEGAGRKEFTLVVKGDVQGSVEAIVGALDKAGNDEVAARVIHSGVGGITESDITLAEASSAVVIGFNVRANKEARQAAEQSNVEIRYYNIIYDLVDDVEKAMSGCDVSGAAGGANPGTQASPGQADRARVPTASCSAAMS
jgi:translation initiation factor IF-2